MRPIQSILIYVGLLIVVLVMVNLLGTQPQDKIDTLTYKQALQLIRDDGVSDLMTTNTALFARKKSSEIPQAEFPTRYDITATIPSETQFYSDVNAIYAEKLEMDKNNISAADYAFNISVKEPEATPWWLEWLPILVTFALFGLLWYFMMRQQTGGKGVMNFGRSRARLTDPRSNKVTFQDVAGAEEEKDELKEIVEFLKDPKRFTELGARIPKGVLLVGPPGTGKTLLARAVSGEAGVPFFTISGSDFVEMFVGVGASRVRDLFDQAKKAAPSIVFIDEIDAVGRQRGAGLGGGHDEREQTLNQLLVEMDGFSHNQGVIVMAATNRADILDPALLRPGRFDRQISVNYPDVKGREEILKVHSRKKPLAKDVDLSVLAKRTPYFTGADLENVMNEGAILTARNGETEIHMATLEEAITKVSAGPEKRSHKITEKDRRLVAYHEAGHAIISHFVPECDNVHEISIVPRGKGAGGYTMMLPDEETNYITSSYFLAEITSFMGGHCAESLVMGDVSTGASSDIQRATQIARAMVTKYGMSKKLGPIFLGGEHEVFLGRDFSQSPLSERVNAEVDQEVQSILNSCKQRAVQVLTEHRAELDRLAEALLKYEKLDQQQFEKIISGGSLEEDKPAGIRLEKESAAPEAEILPNEAQSPSSADSEADAFSKPDPEAAESVEEP